jgi:hypothetical protein
MLRRFLLALGLALACGTDCRAAPRAIELPRDFAVTPIGQRMVLNGLPVEVAAVSAALEPQQACDLIAGHWSRIQPAAVIGCRRSGDWLLVTRRAGSKVQTAQLRQSAAGVAGFISQLDLRAPVGTSAAPRLPLPAGTRVLSVLQSTGPEGESRQFTLALPLPPLEVLRQFSVRASRLGWRSTLSPGQPPRAGTVEFSRGAELIQATVVRCAGGSGVVLLEQDTARRLP